MQLTGRRSFLGRRSRPSSWSLLAGLALARGGDDALVLPKSEIPEARLVDVAIDLFSPGVSDSPGVVRCS